MSTRRARRLWMFQYSMAAATISPPTKSMAVSYQRQHAHIMCWKMIRRNVYESVIFLIHTLLQCLGTKLKVYSKQLYKIISFPTKMDYIFKKDPKMSNAISIGMLDSMENIMLSCYYHKSTVILFLTYVEIFVRHVFRTK